MSEDADRVSSFVVSGFDSVGKFSALLTFSISKSVCNGDLDDIYVCFKLCKTVPAFQPIESQTIADGRPTAAI